MPRAFFGKWHIGEDDNSPQKGFDEWESFRGQGVYYNPVLNINGSEKKYGDSTYITDLLTQNAIGWIDKQDKTQTFLCIPLSQRCACRIYAGKKIQRTVSK